MVDPTTFNYIERRADWNDTVNYFLGFMNNSRDKDMLREELKKLDGQSEYVIRKTITDQLIPRIKRYLMQGFEFSD